MLANIITASRLFLTFPVILLLGRHSKLDITLIFTIVLIFILDALDGIVARNRNEISENGALFDTLTDRIIENTFWIYFAAIGIISLWIPIVVMARGLITDTLQRTHGYPQNGWTYALTHSRVSRGLYGVVKMLAFMILATASVFNNAPLKNVSIILATLAVVFCLLRGLPFFFIRKTPCPRST